jgi:hypothetical protein
VVGGMNAVPMIGQCMRYQKDNDVTFDSTIAWTPYLFVLTDSNLTLSSSSPVRVPLLMLKIDGSPPA